MASNAEPTNENVFVHASGENNLCSCPVSIKTGRKGTLKEEMIIVSIIIIIFLFHIRSSLVVIIMLPIAILISFILMSWVGITSNIMSLSGIAIAIGVIVDAAIVMVENTYRHLSDAQIEKEKTNA